MTVDGRADASGCDIVALVPRASDSAQLLCASAATGTGTDERRSLPHARLGAGPSSSEISHHLARLLGEPVTLLRANTLSWHKNYDASSMMIEVEPLTRTPPGALRWESIEGSDVEGVSPKWARASLAAWLRERESGWSDRRPQWSRPGWMSEASTWMQAHMEAGGYLEPRPAKIHHLWGISVVLSADALNGTAYLKCSGAHFRNEATVTRSLAEHSTEFLPEVVAVDGERGWLLMRDLRARPVGDQPESEWGVGLDALAALQQQWLGRKDELLAVGVADRPLSSLAAWVAGTVDDVGLLKGLPSNDREDWLSQVPAMAESCLNLADLGPEPALLHGDFNPWNVVSGEHGVRIFDWTDAAFAHPFLDLTTYIMQCRDRRVRRAMLRRYLDSWVGHLPSSARTDIGRLALVVGALHQAHSHHRLIPTVLPDDLSQLRGGDVQWLRRAMRFSKVGLLSDY